MSRRVSNKALVKRIQALGLTHDEATLAFRATLRAIVDTLLEGEPVVLHNFGRFSFKFRKGRKLPERTVPTKGGVKTIAAVVQMDSFHLRFKVSPRFQKRLSRRA